MKSRVFQTARIREMFLALEPKAENCFANYAFMFAFISFLEDQGL